ncbi:MAG TPA: protein phosphatase 2C domain-containing protein [Lacipirellulaceae bacterium]|nr:protein phosphatase 2C domain-containing protein [Lacipirellulaceae bacterium]
MSDVGMRRSSNQDSLAVSLAADDKQARCRGHLFVVADGMGAHAAGELASQLATDNIPHAYHKRRDLAPWDAIVAAVEDANGRIHAKGQNSVDFHGMGTTCSCLLLLEEGAVAAHVGDSRIYRLRGTTIEQLTFDHSLVWEMAAAGHASEDEVPAYVPKNVITRSLGPHSAVKVDLEGPLAVSAGDRFLLCSDGLTGPLNPKLIGMILASLPPDEAAQTLVDLANLLGGPDNITVIVAEVTEAMRSRGPLDCESTGPASAGGSLAPEDWLYVALASGGLLAAIGLGAAGSGIGAIVSAVLGVAVAVFGVTRRLARHAAPQHGRVSGQFGKGPHRRYAVEPSAENIEMLSDVVRQLEDLEDQRKWPFDWGPIHEDRGRALRSIGAGDYSAAVVAYSSAVRRLMHAVRQTRLGTSDSGIQLGRD